MAKKRFNASQRANRGKDFRAPDSASTAIDTNIFSVTLCSTRKSHCLSLCNDEQKAAFADTVLQLSQLRWTEIDTISRRGMGYELLENLKVAVPTEFTDKRIIGFKFWQKARMVGYRSGGSFHVLWFDVRYDVYDHGH